MTFTDGRGIRANTEFILRMRPRELSGGTTLPPPTPNAQWLSPIGYHSHKFAGKNVSMVTGRPIHACFMMPALREGERQLDEEMRPNAHLRRIAMRISLIILL